MNYLKAFRGGRWALAAAAVILAAGLGLVAAGCGQNEIGTPQATSTALPPPPPLPADYKGTPWKGEAQVVPGKVLAAFYDVGGEGVAFHDGDKVNSGSGGLNQGPEEKNNFRKNEPVDISYTKAAFDHWPNGVLLPLDLYYVGWTGDGEWVNYTVDVKAAGTYLINLMASSHDQNAQISFSVNGVDQTGPITLVSTTDWHIWGMFNDIGQIRLNKGRQLITLKFVKQGNMNVHYFELVPVGGTK
jgi:hypothetical protein